MAKLIIIGLDAGTFDLVLPWVMKDRLPNLKKLMQAGVSAKVISTIPQVSAQAWPVIYTGKNPGEIGAYNFSYYKENSYETTLINSTKIKAKCLWDYITEAGKSCAIAYIPTLYPPRKINGIMVTGGMLTPDASQSTWPADFHEEFPEGYKLFAPAYEGMDKEQFIKENLEIFEQQKQVIDKLIAKNFDLVLAEFTITDIFGHIFWKEQEEEQSNALFECYRRIDEYVGKLMEKDANLIVMSDHGMGKLDEFFYVNDWLIRERYLRLKGSKPLQAGMGRIGFTRDTALKILTKLRLKGLLKVVPKKVKEAVPIDDRGDVGALRVDWGNTKVFAGSFGQLYINNVGVRPQGIVTDKEYPELIAEIKDKLKAVFKERKLELYEKKDLFKGEHADNAPDLTIMVDDNKMITEQSTGHETLFGLNRKTGTGHHRLEGMFIASGQLFKKKIWIKDMKLADFTPTILSALGIPLPKGLEGRVVEEAFEGKPDESGKPGKQGPEAKSEEKEKVDQAIKGLRL
ncbi:MAG: alkaline phosphatase family protein [Nanoarchaeota archaeon]|nr:alkaline phosphatase family protein [Nanoarchaeota archaeon]